MLLLCILTLIFSPGSLGGGCGSNFVSGNAVIQIDAACRYIDGRLTQSPPAFVFPLRGSLLDDNCTFYDGVDKHAPYLGVYTGDGLATGFISFGGQLYYECHSTQNRPGEEFAFERFTARSDCSRTVPSYDLPTQYLSRGGTSGVPGFSVCLWDFTNNFPRNYTLDFMPLSLDSPGFLAVKPFDPMQDAVVFGSWSTQTHFNQHSVQIQDTGFTVMFLALATSRYVSANVIADPVIHCSQQEMFFALSPSQLEILNATTGDVLYISTEPVNNVSSLDPKCRDARPSPTFNFNINECPSIIEASSTDQISYIYTIWNLKPMNLGISVQRYIRHFLNITCSFNTTAEVNSINVKPNIQQVGAAEDPVDGNFDVSLQLFANESFSVPLTADATVTVPDFIAAKVKLENIPDTVDDLIMQMEECWATQTSNPMDIPTYPIITGSCAAVTVGEDPTTRQVLSNYRPTCGTFKFQSFVWTNFTETEQAIYVHCDVSVCQNSSGGCTVPVCSSKRRSINQDQYRRLSFGPVNVLKSQKANDCGNGKSCIEFDDDDGQATSGSFALLLVMGAVVIVGGMMFIVICVRKMTTTYEVV